MQFPRTEIHTELFAHYKYILSAHYYLFLEVVPHEAPLTELIYERTIHVIRFPANKSDIFFSYIMGPNPKRLINTVYVFGYES